MTNLTPSDFIKIIDYRTALRRTVSNINVMSIIQPGVFKIVEGLTIENCTFPDDVIFTEIDLNIGIKFINCQFDGKLIFKNCYAKEYSSTFNEGRSHLEFDNVKIGTLHFDGENKIERGVRICGKSEIGNLVINSLKCEIGGFVIDDSSIQSDFTIEHSIFQNSISISNNSQINTPIKFKNVTARDYHFNKSTFIQDLDIRSGNVRSIFLTDSTFNEDVKFEAVLNSSNLVFNGSVFKKNVHFKLPRNQNKKGNLFNINFLSGKFGEKLIIEGYEKDLTGKSVVSQLEINSSKQLEGAMYFKLVDFENVIISGDYYNNIVFNNCNFNMLQFNSFFNYSSFSIISSRAFGDDSKLSLKNTNLGKAQLFNTHLNTFDSIFIENSILIDIITANITWFEYDQLNPKEKPSDNTKLDSQKKPSDDTKSDLQKKPSDVTKLDSQKKQLLDDTIHKAYYVQKKEIFRQLKFASEKQGDRISSLNFRALEMRAFKEELKVGKKSFYKYLGLDTSILWLSQTNDFGLNYIKPILIAIPIVFLSYSLLIIDTQMEFSSDLSYEGIINTGQVFVDNLDKVPQLLDPTHSLSRLFPENTKLSQWTHYVDYFLKITTTFFIFQTVSAFRKFIKD